MTAGKGTDAMLYLINYYLKFARGESRFSFLNLFFWTQFVTRAWMRFRIWCYERGIFKVTEPKLPVISIGNNSLGGTNKTPMSEYIVRMFREAGVEAGLVSRGYKTSTHEPIWIGQDERSYTREVAGDEPLMLAKRLPGVKIAVSPDRVAGVALLASLGVQLAVTDDTFQHRRMDRDVDIVLVDGTCPFGNNWVIPVGLMREQKSAFGRADIVVITKTNQVSAQSVSEIRAELEKYVSPEKIFTAQINNDAWLVLGGGEERILPIEQVPGGNCVVFSAIGNPEGFYNYIKERGIKAVSFQTFRDHHVFTEDDIAKLQGLAQSRGAGAFICTEKDMMNLPKGFPFKLPIYVLRISVHMNEKERFEEMICRKLKPKLMVTSNGYGEDAIGVVLAKKIRSRLRAADVSAFVFVGKGTQYSAAGIPVISPPSEMPSGGIIKYSAYDLFKDLRHGLGESIKKQLEAMRRLKGFRTPVCVGDVYLFMNVLWGQGISPVLLATAKTVHLSGHMRIERFLLRKRTRQVWTRDEETAHELVSDGVNAVFYGNPVMDLINTDSDFDWGDTGDAERIVLLPGSRPRVYDDIKLVVASASELAKRVKCKFVMVPAQTTDLHKMVANLEGWELSEDCRELKSEDLTISIYFGGHVADPAKNAKLLIGLGGTANQLCAGLGVPVVSILEVGKLRQKKLLRDAEILVDANAKSLAGAAEKILKDPELHKFMSDAGKKALGGHGSLDNVVEYCAHELGWDLRCEVYSKFAEHLKNKKEENAAPQNLRGDAANKPLK